MSNSIWHKKHVFVVDRNGQVVVKLDDGTYDIVWVKKDNPLQDVIVFSENGIKFIEEYCYLDELLTQADKAERLQKAVDYALQVLDNVSEIGGIDLEMIKIEQMIKGE